MPDSKAPASSIPSAADPGRVGVLLINLGTPEATDYWSMRRYLKEFLSDRRVIETNRAVWWFVLNAIVLTTRPSKSGHAYDQIWNRELNESPLKTVTRAQAEGLARHFAGDDRVVVEWAMRYGLPATAEGIASLQAQGCDRILLFPLYPQYAASTTATALDKAYEALMKLRRQPAIRTVPPYYDHPAYIDALARSLNGHLATLDFEPEVILASFHGLPEDYVAKGDPYQGHCQETVRLLRAATGFDEARLRLTFQSRFGKAEWLKPYTDETVAELARRGVRNLVMITPGFAADCVETLEEIAIQAGATFRDHGGVNYSVAPCLNAAPESLAMLARLTEAELAGWL